MIFQSNLFAKAREVRKKLSSNRFPFRLKAINTKCPVPLPVARSEFLGNQSDEAKGTTAKGSWNRCWFGFYNTVSEWVKHL